MVEEHHPNNIVPLLLVAFCVVIIIACAMFCLIRRGGNHSRFLKTRNLLGLNRRSHDNNDADDDEGSEIVDHEDLEMAQAATAAPGGFMASSTRQRWSSVEQHPPVYCVEDLQEPPPAYQAIFSRGSRPSQQELLNLRCRLDKLKSLRNSCNASRIDRIIREAEIAGLEAWIERLQTNTGQCRSPTPTPSIRAVNAVPNTTSRTTRRSGVVQRETGWVGVGLPREVRPPLNENGDVAVGGRGRRSRNHWGSRSADLSFYDAAVMEEAQFDLLRREALGRIRTRHLTY